jgi:hypothetical protein
MPPRKKSRLISVLAVLVIVLGLLLVLNPGVQEFKGVLSSQAAGGAKTKLGENSIGGIASTIAGGVGSLAANAYERSDCLFFSLYTFKVGGKAESRYLGFMKIFMKLK